MNRKKAEGRLGRGGFTLTEVLIASAISLVIVAGMIGFFVSTFSYWHEVNLRMDADSDVNIALSRMVYGMGDRFGLRAASAGSVQIVSGTGGGWTVNYNTGGNQPQTNSFTYSAANKTLVFNPGSQIAGRDVAAGQAVLDGAVLHVSLRVEKVRS